MELNRDQVIKALECCINDECDKCGVPFGNCQANLMQDALSLINELTEDNEAQAETITNLIETIKSIQADTVREIQERLHERKVSYGNITFRVVPIDDIDQIAKEMVEDYE